MSFLYEKNYVLIITNLSCCVQESELLHWRRLRAFLLPQHVETLEKMALQVPLNLPLPSPHVERTLEIRLPPKARPRSYRGMDNRLEIDPLRGTPHAPEKTLPYESLPRGGWPARRFFLPRPGTSLVLRRRVRVQFGETERNAAKLGQCSGQAPGQTG